MPNGCSTYSDTGNAGESNSSISPWHSPNVPLFFIMACNSAIYCRSNVRTVTSSASEIAQYLKFTSYEIRLSHECDKLLRRIDDYFNPYAKNDFDLNREEKEFKHQAGCDPENCADQYNSKRNIKLQRDASR